MTNLEVRREQVVDIAELLVDHNSKDAHLGDMAFVQLDCALLHFHHVAQLVPPKVQGTILEVSLDLGWPVAKSILVCAPRHLLLILVGGFHCPCGNHLHPDCAREVVKDGKSWWGVVCAWEVHTSMGDKEASHSKRGNMAVLKLHPAKVIKFFLAPIGTGAHTKQNKEAKGHLGAELLQ
jgi:hypothetical protein